MAGGEREQGSRWSGARSRIASALRADCRESGPAERKEGIGLSSAGHVVHHLPPPLEELECRCLGGHVNEVTPVDDAHGTNCCSGQEGRRELRRCLTLQGDGVQLQVGRSFGKAGSSRRSAGQAAAFYFDLCTDQRHVWEKAMCLACR